MLHLATMPCMNVHTKEVSAQIIDQITKVSRCMFNAGLFGIFHGSISGRISQEKFVVNRRNAILDSVDESALILLDINYDYRYNDASMDAYIHAGIYESFSEAKFIVFAAPPAVIAFSLKNTTLNPSDYFGFIGLSQSVPILDPKDYETWEERANVDIVRFLKQSQQEFVIIRGYGIYAFGRDLTYVAKLIALIEHSCHIITLSQPLDLNVDDDKRFGI